MNDGWTAPRWVIARLRERLPHPLGDPVERRSRHRLSRDVEHSGRVVGPAFGSILRAVTNATEPVVFAPGMEGLVRAMDPIASPAVWAELKGRGFDRAKALQAAYPVATWLEVLEAGVRACQGQSREEALRQLGAQAIAGFRQTLVGAALFQLLALIGLERGLKRVTRSFRNGNNFLELELTHFEPGRATLHALDVAGVPEHFLGMLMAGCEAVGAREVKGRVLSQQGAAADFELTWKP